MQSGSVRHLAMSFDDSCFLSAAQDGSLVVLQNGLPGAPGGQQPGQAPPLAPMLSAGVEAAQDLGNGALSFEEGRQAAVADALATQAAEAKQGLRSEFEAVRSELRQLLATNAARPAGQRLPRSAFSIDPGECLVSVGFVLDCLMHVCFATRVGRKCHLGLWSKACMQCNALCMCPG